MITSSADFLKLIGSDDVDERQQARLCHALEEVWIEIIELHPDARTWVACNKTIPHSIIEMLFKDDDEKVRWWIAIKRKISVETIEELSRDVDPSVRQRIVYNKSTPLHVLENLVFDEDEDVAFKAKERVLEARR